MLGTNLKSLYESFKAESADPRHGPTKFATLVRNTWLGLDKDIHGRTCLKADRMARPEEFSLLETTKAMLGENWEQVLDRRRQPFGAHLLEAGNTAIQPSQFIDISAWDVTVGGLIEAKLIEGFQTPEYIGDKLTKKIPSKMNGEKIIGIGRIGDKAEVMTPGQPHPRAQFTERFITTPAPTKRGLAVEVTKEAVFFDLTNNVLTTAESVGKEIGLRKEKLIFDTIIGSVNNPYNYGSVAYNTYLTSGNWINTQSNQLTDWTNLNLAWYLLSKMTDQEASERISIQPDTILCTPFLVPTVQYVRKATTIEPLTSGSSSVYNAGQRTLAPNVTDYFGKSLESYELLSSPILHQRLTDASGANLSDTNARQYWWIFDRGGAFGYVENWPLNVTQAPANDYIMADNDMVLAVFGNERGIPIVLEPRKVIRNTN